MNRKTIIQLCAGIAIIVALIASVASCRSNKKEADRLADNQLTLIEKMESYRLADSSSMAQVNALTLQKNEFADMYADKVAELQAMGIKYKNLQSYSKSVAETIVTITDTLQDSIYIDNGRIDTIQCISYNDGYNTIDGCLKDNVFTGEMTSRDTLIQAVHYTYDHYFLFFRWGKRLKQSVRSTNPKSTIIYDEYIQVE